MSTWTLDHPAIRAAVLTRASLQTIKPYLASRDDAPGGRACAGGPGPHHTAVCVRRSARKRDTYMTVYA
eukprot:6907325-Prymnesium_polylepis.1